MMNDQENGPDETEPASAASNRAANDRAANDSEPAPELSAVDAPGQP